MSTQPSARIASGFHSTLHGRHAPRSVESLRRTTVARAATATVPHGNVIIGVTVVRADGETAKAGGIVVKNVAGYDLSRLMTGAFGSLGVVVDATFKLAPVAPASRTVLIELGSIEAMAPIVADLVSSALTPSAVELQWPPARILVRFESVEGAVEPAGG